MSDPLTFSSTNGTVNPLEPLPKPQALNNTFGAVLIGTFISLILYGMMLHQLYRYCILYPSDKRWLRWTVFATIVLDTVHMAMCCHICYWYLVVNYFNPAELLFGSWSIKATVILSGLIIFISQSFFAWRVYLVGPRYRILVYVAMILLIGELAFFTAATIESFILPTFTGFEHAEWLISVGSAQAITADSLLTGVLIVTLHWSRTGIKRTDSMIDVLILYAVSTGLLTTIFNLLAFIFVLAFPGNLIYVAFSVIVTKLYANTLLVALNTRQSFSRGGLVQDSDIGLYGSSTVVGSTIRFQQRVTLTGTNGSSKVSGSGEMVESGSFVLEIKADASSSESCAHRPQS